MRFALIICSIVVGSTLILDVDSTTPLLAAPLAAPLLLGGEVLKARLIPRLHLFENFIKSIHQYFGERLEGFHSFIDGFGRGIQGILTESFGDDCGKFLGPLSQIPEGTNLEPLLGDKLKSRADVFATLIPLAKKYCATGDCEKLPALEGKPTGALGGEIENSLGQYFSSFDQSSVSRLDRFHSNVDNLIKSQLENGKHGEVLELLSKLPPDVDPSLVLGKEGCSHSVDGKLTREDLLPLLVQFSKSKCPGCGKS